MQSSFRFHMGAPAPNKTNGLGCVGGKHVGVGFLSSFPARNQVAGWSPELYGTARIHASRFQVGQPWVHGGVAYGFAAGSDTAQVREHTEQLLQQLTLQVEPDKKGLKFIGGDFNQHEGKLAECKLWESLGWKELQQVAFERWHVQPGVTCKGTSRKDYLYLSPDLQKLLVGVVNQSTPFPDHHLLYGSFNLPSPMDPVYHWHMPLPIDYSAIDVEKFHAECTLPVVDKQMSPSDQYAAIFAQFEQEVTHFQQRHDKPGLSDMQAGRGQIMDRRLLSTKPSPPKNSRPGDPVPQFGGWKTHHCRWFSQLKRLINFRNMNCQTRRDPVFLEHKLSLWRAIRRASGFSPTFVDWWNQRHSQLMLSEDLPNPDLCHALVTQFEVCFRALESELQDTRRTQVAQLYAQDANKVFRDVKQPPHAPLEVLLADTVSEIREVPEPNTLRLSDATQFDTALPVSIGGLEFEVIDQLEDKVWLTQDHDMSPGMTVVQTKELGKVADIHAAFEAHWAAKWDRHKDAEPAHWDVLWLGTADVAHSRISPAWNLEEAGMLRVLQVGTFCAADKLHSAKVVESDKCKFCQAPDSLSHRHLECPAFASARMTIPPAVLSFVQQAPACILRGWIPEPNSLSSFRKALLQIPDDVSTYEPIPSVCQDLEVWDLFIDGSARHPQLPCARLAAWSVVIAGPWHVTTGFPLARGYVQGLWQTVLRAEITSMLSALGVVARTSRPCRIWVDNQQVFARTTALLRQEWAPTHMTSDSDLWFLVHDQVAAIGDRVTVCKVASHQDVTGADEWEAWAFRHNELADACANATYSTYLHSVVALSDAVAAEWKFLDEVKQHWHSFLVHVAKQSIAQPELPRATDAAAPRDCTVAVDLGHVAKVAHGHAPKNLHFAGWMRVLTWLEQIASDPMATSEWVTWYELLWSLQLNLGGRGIVSTGTNNTWKWADSLQPFDMQRVTRNLSSWLTQLIKLAYPGWKSSHARPSCYRFQCWAMTVKISWNRHSRLQVQNWLQAQLGDLEIHQINQVFRLPEAHLENVEHITTNPRVGLHRFGFL
eukprot:Skav203289  [mRNA]  locus=scaffold324:424296:429005:+ [translate_table: standard]